MSEPFEILAAPFTAYLAPVGTAFPLIDAAPAAEWIKVGTSGDRNYAEDGVTVVHEQTIELIRTLGSTGAVKALRTAEGLMVRFTLLDLSLDQYATALNGNTVTETAAGSGTAGFQELPLYRGLDVTLYALLLRGKGPIGAAYDMQFEVPVCFQSGSPEPVLAKGAPAGLALEFTALEDPDAATEGERFGQIVAKDAVALA